mmetsp:Transcript_55257/g.134229  ORF Transcript_55257/g.134229 Transcript_55257/m.134229 type:complete len:386 (-) Transcript_55257:77-1234(-)
MMSLPKNNKDDEKLPATSAAAGQVQQPKKKGRKPKPPGFPKRPLSAYNLFFREERQKVLHLDFQNMGKEISSRWKQTDSEGRAKYEAQAKVDAKRYRVEVKAYEEEQARKKHSKPKQPPSKKNGKTAKGRTVASMAAGGIAPSTFPVQEVTAPSSALGSMMPPMFMGTGGLLPQMSFQDQLQLQQQLLADKATNDSAAFASAFGPSAFSVPSSTGTRGLSSCGSAANFGGNIVDGLSPETQVQAQLRELHFQRLLMERGLGGMNSSSNLGMGMPADPASSILDAMGLQHNNQQQQQQELLLQHQLRMQMQAQQQEADYMSLLRAAHQQQSNTNAANGTRLSNQTEQSRAMNPTGASSSSGVAHNSRILQQMTKEELEEAIRKYHS